MLLILKNLSVQCSIVVSFLQIKKVEKNSFQRITYRIFETNSGTSSSLELFPQSQLLHDIHILQQTSFDVQCEVSIMNVYHKSVSQRVRLANAQSTLNATVSLNAQELETKRNAAGDPDNAPLTGLGVATARPMACSVFASSFMAIYLMVMQHAVFA